MPLSDAGRRGLERLCDTLLPLAHRGDAWLLLARYLFETSGYLTPLFATGSAASQQKRLAIYQLLLTVQQMTDRLPVEPPERPRAALLDRLRRLLQLQQSRSVRIPDTGALIDAVRIMTIHQSKGLEFPVVDLPNLVQGQFPARGRGAMGTLPGALVDVAETDDGSEEELFFVALSRARDELLLSRPATWRGKPAGPAPLLERITEALAAAGAAWTPVAARIEQPQTIVNGQPAEAPSDAAIPLEKPTVSLSRLRQYQACPRQYYYRHVLQLPERDEDTAYRKFHRGLQQTLEWLHAEHAAGREPTAADARATFRAKWPEGLPEVETGVTRVLRERANLMLDRARPHIASASQPAAREEFKAELESGTVELSGDEVETRPGGGVRITQHLHRRPKKDDHTAEPLALIRLAAKQRDTDLPVGRLFLTVTGETREVAEDRRWEPKRVEKFDVALRELAAGRFPAKPGEQVPSCPFFFICPA